MALKPSGDLADPDVANLEWSLGFCISNMFPGHADAAGPWITLGVTGSNIYIDQFNHNLAAGLLIKSFYLLRPQLQNRGEGDID